MNTGENILPRQGGQGQMTTLRLLPWMPLKCSGYRTFNKYTLSYWKGLEPAALAFHLPKPHIPALAHSEQFNDFFFFLSCSFLLYIKWNKESKMSTVGATQEISYSQSCFSMRWSKQWPTHTWVDTEGISGALLTVYTARSKSLSGSSPADGVTALWSVHATFPIKSASLQPSSTSVCESRMSVVPSIRKRKNIASNQGKKKKIKIQTTKNLQYRFFPLLMRMFFSVQVFFVI